MVHTAPGEPGNLFSPLEDPGSLPWMLYDPPWKTREFVELNYQLYFILALSVFLGQFAVCCGSRLARPTFTVQLAAATRDILKQVPKFPSSEVPNFRELQVHNFQVPGTSSSKISK